MGRFTGLLGLIVILAVAWLFSTHKREIKLRLLAWGMGLQFFFALLVLKTDFGIIFQRIGDGVNAMLSYAEVGSQFLFGPLGTKAGPYGVLFAFQVLPIVIFIASFFSILYYLGVMQVIVKAMAVGMQKVMGVSGAESLNVAASIFMGQTEAPLTIKPFLAGLTESELFTIMTAGMAHVSGAVMAAYVKIAGVSITHLLTAVIMTAPATIMLAKIFIPETEKPATAGRVDVKIEKTAVNVIDAAAQGAGDGLHLALNIGGMLIAFLAGLTESELFTIMTAGMAHVSGAVMAAYVKIAGVSITHLLTAVIMTAPATIMLAKIFIPETEKPATAGRVDVKIEKTAVNVIDAAAQGAGDGLHLALNIGGMLIAFLALIAMVNGILGWVHTLPGMGWMPASLERIFGLLFAPVAWLLGVPWKDCSVIGDLLGTRLVLNEFVSFLKLGPLKASLDPKSFTIATYALCGFANFSSIAIQIGGIGALAPTRKSDLARLGLRAVAAGTMANFMSACIAGMLL